MSAAPVAVAVGVLIRPDGSFLIAQRPPGKPMAGYWEFPGGKLEPGETVAAALRREFLEELGVEVLSSCPWAQRIFTYPHATVRLHYRRVFEWRGAPRPLEGQAFQWERIDALRADPWLPGALPLRRWLTLPDCYAISNATELGTAQFLRRLETRLADGRVRLLQLREPGMAPEQLATLAREVRARLRAHGARLLLNSRHADLAQGDDGLHLTAADLLAAPRRPDHSWVMASCHDAAQLAHAGALDLDAAVLGPVLPTPSHPGAAGLGWEGFAAAAAATTVPVYALGGLDPAQLALARSHGAHGVAAQRAVWL